MKWLCHQLGSREHYSVPRSLYTYGELRLLQVDAWVSPHWKSLLNRLGQGALAGRYHDGLSRTPVVEFTMARLRFDLIAKAQGLVGWDLLLKRNEWFQNRCIPRLERELKQAVPGNSIVFSYSYTSRKLFQFAKAHGAYCVLGQIDPGPEEFRWVAEQIEKTGGRSEAEPPTEYWELWREEVKLADRIIVNSPWSMEMLRRSGVPDEKMRIVPLAYENVTVGDGGSGARGTKKKADGGRLRVLFLGQVIARKGVFPLFEAIRELSTYPVEFDLAGPIGVEIPKWIRKTKNVTIHGAVSRPEADLLYQCADVFILPTFSDGFAITQLEAAANGLPLIVSRYCGQVVQDGVNGIILPEVSTTAIVTAIQRLLNESGLVARLSSHPLNEGEYSLDTLGKRLQALGAELVGH